MAGEVIVLGPYANGDSVTITAALSGAVVVADDLTSWTDGTHVWYGIVKA